MTQTTLYCVSFVCMFFFAVWCFVITIWWRIGEGGRVFEIIRKDDGVCLVCCSIGSESHRPIVSISKVKPQQGAFITTRTLTCCDFFRKWKLYRFTLKRQWCLVLLNMIYKSGIKLFKCKHAPQWKILINPIEVCGTDRVKQLSKICVQKHLLSLY